MLILLNIALPKDPICQRCSETKEPKPIHPLLLLKQSVWGCEIMFAHLFTFVQKKKLELVILEEIEEY